MGGLGSKLENPGHLTLMWLDEPERLSRINFTGYLKWDELPGDVWIVAEDEEFVDPN